jgi:nucleotide-binding universal stress UspA family protein
MTYKKVLAAVPDSPVSADVLRAGSDIANAAGAALIALRLVDDPWPYIEPGEVEAKRALRDNAWHRVATGRVTDELHELSAQTSGVAATPAVRIGPPRDEIARSADADRADLIVLGRPPVGPPEPAPSTWALDGTLRRARVPCLIVPPGHRGWQRIVVLADGSLAMADVLKAAFALAGLFRSDVVVVETAPESERDGRKAFAEWARLPGAGAFDVRVHQGDPATAAADAARAERADVIVMGYPRGAGITDASPLARIVRGAPCAVLAVPV